MDNLITVLWVIGSSLVLIISSYLICCLIGHLNTKIKAKNEKIRKKKARTKIVDGIMKVPVYNQFFKASYYEMQEITEYTQYTEEEDENEDELINQMTPEEEEEYLEVYERRGDCYKIGTFGKVKNHFGEGFRKNPEHEYSRNYPTTTYTQTDYLTDYTTKETENITMTITDCCNGEVYEYDTDEVEVSSEAMMKKILQKIRDNHDSELIKGRI